MDAFLLTKEEFYDLRSMVENLNNHITTHFQKPEDVIFDNEQFIRFMNISKRTAQKWRDEKCISYSQVGYKIYYKYSDIQQLLDKNHIEAKNLLPKKS